MILLSREITKYFLSCQMNKDSGLVWSSSQQVEELLDYDLSIPKNTKTSFTTAALLYKKCIIKKIIIIFLPKYIHICCSYVNVYAWLSQI